MMDKENSLKNEEHGIKDKNTYLKDKNQQATQLPIPGLSGLGLKPFVVTTDGIPCRICPTEGSAHTCW